MNTPSTPPPSPPQPIDLRRRLRELLCVPERDRTDEQWDEIVELEIQLAPGNRVTPASPGSPNTGQGPAPGAFPQQKKHRPRNNRRPNKPKPPV